MNSKRNVIIAVVVVVVVAAAGILLWKGGVKLPGQPQGTQTPQGVVAAPGASPIATSGQVVTKTGQPVKLDVSPGTPEAPQQSNPISPKQLPPAAIKLTMTASGITPSAFTVKSGEAVTLSATSGDTQTHILQFDDPSLEAVALGLAPGETRAITFNAPKAGVYKFHCGVPGHAARGEAGQMTVQ